MKIINLNSKFDLSEAQVSFAEAVIIGGENNTYLQTESISHIMNKIPILLVDIKTQEEHGQGDLLGFYMSKCTILGFVGIPVIGLCVEKIMSQVKNNNELIILIAKVLIHEFAHALMDSPENKIDRSCEFYKWMEEPMANVITLTYFRNFEYQLNTVKKEIAHIKPLPNVIKYVRKFIANQPHNYKLGLDLFDNGITDWKTWREYKKEGRRMEPEFFWHKYTEETIKNKEKINRIILQLLFSEITRREFPELKKDCQTKYQKQIIDFSKEFGKFNHFNLWGITEKYLTEKNKYQYRGIIIGKRFGF